MIEELASKEFALLSKEGSGIAKRIPRGVVPRRNLSRFALEPPRRFAPPLLTQEGSLLSQASPLVKYLE